MEKSIFIGFAMGLFMFCTMGASEASIIEGTQVEINNLDYLTGSATASVGVGLEFTNPPDTVLGGLTSVDVFDVTSTTSAVVYNVGSSINSFDPAPNRLSISFLDSNVPTIASVSLSAIAASAGYNDINRVGFTSNSVYYDFGSLPRDLSSVRLDVQFVSEPIPATRQAEGILKYIPAIIAASQGAKEGPEYDNDLDGYSENQGDCNDNNNRIYPGAIDICGDSIDQDCDGVDSVCQQSWIVGSWNLTHLEGVPAGVSYSSIWTFNSDGTYSLFFHAPPYYDEKGGGDYSLSGNILTVRGIATQIFGYSTQVSVPLNVSADNNTFSFVDDEWDRWTFSKM